MHAPARLAVGVSALIAAALLAGPAAADSLRVIHDRHADDLTRIDTTTCSFPVTTHFTANIDDALFFDPSGNLVRLLETVNHAQITYTANGKTLTARGSGGFDLRFNADGSRTVSTFGINLLLTLPGRGTVFLDVGRAEILFDPNIHILFQAGPADYDIAAFCAALA
jgi:hypothetical protein